MFRIAQSGYPESVKTGYCCGPVQTYISKVGADMRLFNDCCVGAVQSERVSEEFALFVLHHVFTIVCITGRDAVSNSDGRAQRRIT